MKTLRNFITSNLHLSITLLDPIGQIRVDLSKRFIVKQFNVQFFCVLYFDETIGITSHVKSSQFVKVW